MTTADWIAIAALAVAPSLALVGVIYRAGTLTAAVKGLQERVEDNGERITSVEVWIRNRANGQPRRDRR